MYIKIYPFFLKRNVLKNVNGVNFFNDHEIIPLIYVNIKVRGLSIFLHEESINLNEAFEKKHPMKHVFVMSTPAFVIFYIHY